MALAQIGAFSMMSRVELNEDTGTQSVIVS